jgi:hypothetical protein
LKKYSAGLGTLLVLLACLAAQPVFASADPLMVMVIAEDWPALEREAKQRLAVDPLDSKALHALGRLSIDSEVGSDALRQTLLQQAQTCIAARPYDALCQLSYGQILGVILNGQGGLSAFNSVGKVQHALEAAVASAPNDYDARESLVTFYLRAPGIVGGSMRRARRNAEDYVSADPDRARLLFALIALQDDDAAKAEEAMAGLPEQSDDADLNRLIAKRWLAIAQTYLDQEKETEAAASFQRALAHGAPSVALAARQALDRLGAGQSAQAGGSLSASR